MVSLELPMFLSVSKDGKHAVTTICQWQTNLSTEIFPIATEFGCH